MIERGGIFAARLFYALKKSLSDRGHVVRHQPRTAISQHGILFEKSFRQ